MQLTQLSVLLSLPAAIPCFVILPEAEVFQKQIGASPNLSPKGRLLSDVVQGDATTPKISHSDDFVEEIIADDFFEDLIAVDFVEEIIAVDFVEEIIADEWIDRKSTR